MNDVKERELSEEELENRASVINKGYNSIPRKDLERAEKEAQKDGRKSIFQVKAQLGNGYK